MTQDNKEEEEFIEFSEGRRIRTSDMALIMGQVSKLAAIDSGQRKVINEKKLEEKEKLNLHYSVVMRGGNALIMREGIDSVTESREISFLNKDAFVLYNMNKTYRAGNKICYHAKDWLEWDGRRQYDNIVFKPREAMELKSPVSYGENSLDYNLWRGWSVRPHEHDISDNSLYSIFLDHLRVNLCRENDKHYKWVLAWIADLFQRPERKNGMAIVMRGKMGTGKGVIARVLGRLCSKHYMLISQRSQITGKFNGHLADKILVFVDEPPFAGDKEAEGVLRSLITEPVLAVEHKGKDTVKIDSFVRIIMATNHEWAVPTGMNDERRMAVFDMREEGRDDKAYFQGMFDQLEANDGLGYRALLHYFLTAPYTDLTLKALPRTDALLDQKILSLPRHGQWWMQCLQLGEVISGEGWREEVNAATVYNEYIAYCENVRESRPIDRLGLSRRIKNMYCPLMGGRSSNSQRFIVLPSLTVCRQLFEQALGQPITWDDGQAQGELLG